MPPPPPNFFPDDFSSASAVFVKTLRGPLTSHSPLSHFSLFKIFHAGFRATKLFKGNFFVKQEKLKPVQQNL